MDKKQDWEQLMMEIKSAKEKEACVIENELKKYLGEVS
jgi:hypothetical protein